MAPVTPATSVTAPLVALREEMLGAIGQVALDAAALEYMLVRVAGAGMSWTDAQIVRQAGKSGAPLRALAKLLNTIPETAYLHHEVCRLREDASECLDHRNRLVHAIVTYSLTEQRPQLWNLRSGVLADPNVETAIALSDRMRALAGRSIIIANDAATFAAANRSDELGEQQPDSVRVDVEQVPDVLIADVEPSEPASEVEA